MDAAPIGRSSREEPYIGTNGTDCPSGTVLSAKPYVYKLRGKELIVLQCLTLRWGKRLDLGSKN